MAPRRSYGTSSSRHPVGSSKSRMPRLLARSKARSTRVATARLQSSLYERRCARRCCCGSYRNGKQASWRYVGPHSSRNGILIEPKTLGDVYHSRGRGAWCNRASVHETISKLGSKPRPFFFNCSKEMKLQNELVKIRFHVSVYTGSYKCADTQ